MKCEEAQQELSEYLDGELSPGQTAGLEEHLEGCSRCRRELGRLRSTVEAVRQLPRRHAPPEMAERIMDRIRSGQFAPRLVQLWPRALAVAAMLLVVVGITIMLERGEFLSLGETTPPRVVMKAPGAPEASAELPPARPAEVTPEKARGPYGKGDVTLGVGEPEPVVSKAAGALGTAQLKEAPQPAPSRAAREEPAPEERSGRAGVTAEAWGARQVEHGLRRAPPPAEEASATMAFGWNGEATDEVQSEAERAAQMDVRQVDADAVRGRPLRVLFTQMAPAKELALEQDQQPDQILTVEAERPLDVAGQAVWLAIDNGLRPTLALTRQAPPDGEQVEVELSVPARRYEDFLSQVFQMAPPQNQRLTNTLVAEREFYFRDLTRRYRNAQRAAEQLSIRAGDKDETAEQMHPERVLRLEQQPLSDDRAARQAGDTLRLAEQHRARPVRLLIRLVRGGTAVRSAPEPGMEEHDEAPAAQSTE